MTSYTYYAHNKNLGNTLVIPMQFSYFVESLWPKYLEVFVRYLESLVFDLKFATPNDVYLGFSNLDIPHGLLVVYLSKGQKLCIEKPEKTR